MIPFFNERRAEERGFEEKAILLLDHVHHNQKIHYTIYSRKFDLVMDKLDRLEELYKKQSEELHSLYELVESRNDND